MGSVESGSHLFQDLIHLLSQHITPSGIFFWLGRMGQPVHICSSSNMGSQSEEIYEMIIVKVMYGEGIV